MNKELTKEEENEQVELIECAAIDCTNTFEPFMNIKKYCSKQCRNRERSRLQREEWASEGLCIRCGKENDNLDEGIQQCTSCLETGRKYYAERKEKFQQKRKEQLLKRIKKSAEQRQKKQAK